MEIVLQEVVGDFMKRVFGEEDDPLMKRTYTISGFLDDGGMAALDAVWGHKKSIEEEALKPAASTKTAMKKKAPAKKKDDKGKKDDEIQMPISLIFFRAIAHACGCIAVLHEEMSGKDAASVQTHKTFQLPAKYIEWIAQLKLMATTLYNHADVTETLKKAMVQIVDRVEKDVAEPFFLFLFPDAQELSQSFEKMLKKCTEYKLAQEYLEDEFKHMKGYKTLRQSWFNDLDDELEKKRSSLKDAETKKKKESLKLRGETSESL